MGRPTIQLERPMLSHSTVMARTFTRRGIPFPASKFLMMDPK